jgi:apolipoprotein N-acyltransferase
MAFEIRSFSSLTATAGEFIRSLTGWRRHLFAFAVGLLSALAFAPFGIFPFLLFAFAALVLLIDGAQRLKRPILGAAFIGWTFGLGHFLAGLYWVGYAFTVDASAHAWQIPFVAVLFPGWLAVYLAVGCGVASALWRPGAARIFIFSAAYGVAEWVRGHFLTGFPWNLPAYGWGASLGVLQSAALIGAYGLSLLTVLLGASLARFCDADSRNHLLPSAMIMLFLLFWIGGDVRLAVVDPGDVPGVRLRLVQPDVPQNEKYLRRYVVRNWQRLIDLSNTRASQPITHLIWPEAAPPFLLTREAVALDDIAVLTNENRVLLTGAERVLATPDGDFHYFNSLYIFAHGGQLLDVYDKFHLVPFGEYLPFGDLLTTLGISKLVDSPGGFTPGDGPHSYAVPGAPAAGPLICYEILFPGAVVGNSRPGWFVNVTDDSWFGPSTGPYQHLLTARVRAIEEGIPVARAANTGISAVIDPVGRVTASLGLGRMGVVDASLPKALGETPYAQVGDLAFVLLLIACALGGYLGPLTTKADRSRELLRNCKNMDMVDATR